VAFQRGLLQNLNDATTLLRGGRLAMKQAIRSQPYMIANGQEVKIADRIHEILSKSSGPGAPEEVKPPTSAK